MDLNTGSLIIEYVFHGKLPMVLVMLIVVNTIDGLKGAERSEGAEKTY